LFRAAVDRRRGRGLAQAARDRSKLGPASRSRMTRSWPDLRPGDKDWLAQGARTPILRSGADFPPPRRGASAEPCKVWDKRRRTHMHRTIRGPRGGESLGIGPTGTKQPLRVVTSWVTEDHLAGGRIEAVASNDDLESSSVPSSKLTSTASPPWAWEDTVTRRRRSALVQLDSRLRRSSSD